MTPYARALAEAGLAEAEAGRWQQLANIKQELRTDVFVVLPEGVQMGLDFDGAPQRRFRKGYATLHRPPVDVKGWWQP